MTDRRRAPPPRSDVHPRPRWAVFGGTFNPVHLGHLFAAERAREACGFSRVYFVPAGTPPHRGRSNLAPARDRLAMVRAAVRGNPAFRASGVELHRPGRSYTVDTMEALRRSLGEGARLSFLLGFDAALALHTWRDLPRLLSRCGIVVIPRPGTAWDARNRARWKRVLRAAGPGAARRIRLLPVAALAVSATEVRRRAARGLSLRYLVPRAVEAYIRDRRLYRGAR